MADGQHAAPGGPAGNRLLATLEQLLAIDETDLHRALDRACHMVAEALRADKVDAALYDSTHREPGRGRHQPHAQWAGSSTPSA